MGRGQILTSLSEGMPLVEITKAIAPENANVCKKFAQMDYWHCLHLLVDRFHFSYSSPKLQNMVLCKSVSFAILNFFVHALRSARPWALVPILCIVGNNIKLLLEQVAEWMPEVVACHESKLDELKAGVAALGIAGYEPCLLGGVEGQIEVARFKDLGCGRGLGVQELAVQTP